VHGAHIDIIFINARILTREDYSVENSSDLLHECPSVFANKCMNTGLDAVDLPGPADFSLLNQIQSCDWFTTSSLSHFLSVLDECVSIFPRLWRQGMETLLLITL
jgi:hypothetical protein